MTDNAIATQVLTRETQCGCGQMFQQAGYQIPHTDQMHWNPLRCPKCQATKDTARALADEEDRKRSHAELVRVGLIRLAVPPLYETVSLETFIPHGTATQQEQFGKIKEIASRYLASWPGIPERQELLLFQGSPGSGKGHLVWSIAQAIVAQHGARVRVVKFADIIRDLREPWHESGGLSENARLERYRALHLLVIDEVSRHAFYGREVKQHLLDIVDHRLEQRRPTILTTNEDDEGIAEILGPALMSRAGAGGKLPFPAVDWRSRPDVHIRLVNAG